MVTRTQVCMAISPCSQDYAGGRVLASQTGLRHAGPAAANSIPHQLIHSFTLNLDLNWDTGMNQIQSPATARWGEGLTPITSKVKNHADSLER